VSEKTKPTTEAMEIVNHRNKVKKLRRLIQNNFTQEDYHVVLTYKKSARPDWETAKKYLKSFHGKMGRRYKKLGIPYKWICVTETRTAAIHHHFIINAAPEMVKILKECWPYGHINLTPLYDNMDVEELAEYLTKETRETKQKAKYIKKHSCEDTSLTQPPSIQQQQKRPASQKGHKNNTCKRVEERASPDKGILHRKRFRGIRNQ
jgi:hypothetical protein